MDKMSMNKLKMHSVNKVDENVERIAKLFPNCVTEAVVDDKLTKVVDFDMLRQELSSFVVEGNEERYQFTWPDKKKSILLANAPIAKTLRPCKEESVDFDTTENLYIEGDNLDVLKLLQETYLGKVKMIYIDPPYNTGNDFVYEDDFAIESGVWRVQSGDFDEEGNRLVKNLDSNGRFHTDWLNMIYPRLKLAKDLLRDDGVIFISIDDNELENLKKICNEVFGSDNALPVVVRRCKVGGGADNKQFAREADFVVGYAKSINTISMFSLPHTEEDLRRYNNQDEIGRFFWDTYSRSGLLIGSPDTDALFYEVTFPDGTKRADRWRRSKERLVLDLASGEAKYTQTNNGWNIHFKQRLNTDGKRPRQILYENIGNTLANDQLKELGFKGLFDYPKPIELPHLLTQIATGKDDIILDFFSGSATTAHAVMQLNTEDGGKRKFIMVQLPEETDEKSEAYKAGYKNICEIGKERIRRAGKKILEDNKDKPGIENIDIGFRVLKCDSTNMKDVYYNPADYEASLFDTLTDNIKEDRTPGDLLFQVMLDLGVLLSSKIEESTLAGKKVFNVADGFLIACFDDKVTEDTIKAIAQQKPYYFVMRDSSMATDSVAANFEQIFATYSPDTVRKVL